MLILGDKVATEKLHLSIDGTLNFASLLGLYPGEIYIGANFGPGIHIKLGDKLHLKAEFKPLSQKVSLEIDNLIKLVDELEPGNTKIRLNYIDVQVLPQYNITPQIFVSTGPQISFLTKALQISEGTLDGRDLAVRLDSKSLFNETDFGVPVEVGYSL